MLTLESNLRGKSYWGEGPWQHEPDKRQWLDPATGLPCLIVRNHLGAWCGYVGVSRGHPLYEQPYDKGNDLDLDVHGGLTYSHHCAGDICHIVEPGEDDDVWWLGFDCAHASDLTPALGQLLADKLPEYAKWHEKDVYRDQAYVTAEVEKLAKQLVAL